MYKSPQHNHEEEVNENAGDLTYPSKVREYSREKPPQHDQKEVNENAGELTYPSKVREYSEEKPPQHDHEKASSAMSYRRILVPTVLYFTLIFALYPLQIQIIIQSICDNKGNDDSDDGECDSAAISSRAAIINTYCSIALYFPTILLTGPYGALINRYGRKLGLVVPITGAVLGALCFLFIHVARPPYFALVAVMGNFLMGLSGGYSTFNVSVFSFTSDTTLDNPQERKKSFPIVEGFIFVPKLFAPVGTGLWVKAYGFTYPLIAAILLGCCAIVWVVFVLPESLPPNAAVRSVPLDLNPMQTFRNVAFIYHHKVKLGRSPLLLISISFCFYFVTYISFASVVILYCKHVFNWGPDTIGFFDGLDGGVHAGSMFFAPYIVHSVFQREFSLLNWIQSGYIARCLFFSGIGLAPSTVFVFAMVAFLVVAGPATPYTRTILANTVLPSEQAQIFAAFSAVESISTLISPLMIVLYSVSASNGMPALPFFVMATLLVCSNLILYYIRITPALRHNLPDEMKSVVVYSSFSSVNGKEEAVYIPSDFFSSGDGMSSQNAERERLISS